MILSMVECPGTGQMMATAITDDIRHLPRVGVRKRGLAARLPAF